MGDYKNLEDTVETQLAEKLIIVYKFLKEPIGGEYSETIAENIIADIKNKKNHIKIIHFNPLFLACGFVFNEKTGNSSKELTNISNNKLFNQIFNLIISEDKENIKTKKNRTTSETKILIKISLFRYIRLFL